MSTSHFPSFALLLVSICHLDFSSAITASQFDHELSQSRPGEAPTLVRLGSANIFQTRGQSYGRTGHAHLHLSLQYQSLVDLGKEISDEIAWLQARGEHHATKLKHNVNGNYYTDEHSGYSDVTTRAISAKVQFEKANNRLHATYDVIKSTTEPVLGRAQRSNVRPPTASITARVSSPANVTRTKRIVGSLIATSFSIYSAVQMADLQAQLSTVQGQVQNFIFSLQKQNDAPVTQHDFQTLAVRETLEVFLEEKSWYTKGQSRFSWDSITFKLQRIVDRFTEATDQQSQLINSLLHHRLHVNALNYTALKEAYKGVLHRTSSKQFFPVINSPADLYQLPTSFIANGPDRLDIFVHVPTSKSRQLMTLYEYVPFPIPFLDDDKLVIYFKPEADILAVESHAELSHQQNTYFTLSHTQLQECTQLGQRFICPFTGVLKVGANSSCLASLFEHDMENTERLCPKWIERPAPQAMQIASNSFLTYSPTPDTFFVNCPARDHYQLHHASAQMVHVPPGCTLTTTGFSITGALDPSTPIQRALVSTWTSDLATISFFKGKELAQILSAYDLAASASQTAVSIQALKAAMFMQSAASKEEQKRKTRQGESEERFWWRALTIVNFVITIGIIAVFIHYNLCHPTWRRVPKLKRRPRPFKRVNFHPPELDIGFWSTQEKSSPTRAMQQQQESMISPARDRLPAHPLKSESSEQPNSPSTTRSPNHEQVLIHPRAPSQSPPLIRSRHTSSSRPSSPSQPMTGTMSAFPGMRPGN